MLFRGRFSRIESVCREIVFRKSPMEFVYKLFYWSNGMRNRIVFCGMILIASICFTANRGLAAEDDARAVGVALVEFNDALNTLFTGDAGPMKEVWSHAEDVTYMGPSGSFQVGWTRIEPYWDKQAAAKLGGKVEPKDIHFAVSPQLSVAHYYEKGENIIDGKSQPVSIRTTTVFRKEDGRWKVIGHHTDTLAYLKK